MSMSPRDAADISVNADQGWRSEKFAHGCLTMNEWSGTHQAAKGAQPVTFDRFTGPGGGDLAPAAAEDVPPPLVDVGLMSRELSGNGDEQHQHQEAHQSVRLRDTAEADTTTTSTAAVTASVPDAATVAAAPPTPSTHLLVAAAKDSEAMDSWTVATTPAALDPPVHDCGSGASGGGGSVTAAPADLAAAASAAASVLKRLASQGTSSPGVACALEQAAQRLTSAFSGAGTASDPCGVAAAAAVSHDGGLAGARGADGGGGGERGDSGDGDVPNRAALLTQTASGRVAKVPSASLDLRPHTGRPEGSQRLLAAAMASVGRLGRTASRTNARRSDGKGERAGEDEGEREGEGEAALTSAATALELALAEISAAATEVARINPAEQKGPGLYFTGAEELPAALPGKVSPPQATAAARNPATMAAVYGNVHRTYAAGLTPPQPSLQSAAVASPGKEGRQDELFNGNDLGTPSASATASREGGGGGVDIPYADVTDRVPPGYQLFLNATSAVIAPVEAPPAVSAGGSDAENVEDIGHVGSPGVYVYDRPDAPPPGVKPAAVVSGFTGAADWAWDDPEMDSPPAPSDGGLVPDSATAVHDAEVAAAAAAMPSVIRDADDPATSPPGAAAAARYDNRKSFALGAIRTNIGHNVAAVTVNDPAVTAARLPPVPADLDAAAREALGPYGHERTAEATAVAVATIAPPRYVTPLPPHLLDILREPSARDLAGV